MIICDLEMLIPKNNMTELYFEEPDIEGFVKKLEGSDFEIEYATDKQIRKVLK